MPWKESDAMDQRLQFVTDALSDRFTMTELCARYGVSRRIGYKWLARFNEDGKRGLANRSRRPHTCPTRRRRALRQKCQKGLVTISTVTTPVRTNSARRNNSTPRSWSAAANAGVTFSCDSASARAWARRFRRGAR
jgi:putative transposase